MSDEAKNGDKQDARVGSVLAGRYRVQRLLGSGGMGSVYLAEHVHMRKTVALKVLHREMTYLDEVVARFEREAVAAARIEHPNVAAATDFGRLEDGSFYLVLEYVAGRSLGAVLKGGALPLERALGIARQIAGALGAAHAAGIVHRDLKPENVMLVEQPDGSDKVKVLDFGIAKVAVPDGKADERPLTRIGTVMGTAAYMSPEQAVGQQVDHRTDLYSLGVILYEMIAGRPPFEADDMSQVLVKKITEPPPPLPEGTPADVVTLVERMLEQASSDRLQSADEVLERMDAIRVAASSPAAVPAVGAASAVSPVSLRTGTDSVGAIDATVLGPPGPTAAAPAGRKRPTRWMMVAAGVVFVLGALGALLAGGRKNDLPAASSLSAAATRTAASAAAQLSASAKSYSRAAAIAPEPSAAKAPAPSATASSKTRSSTTVTRTETPGGRQVVKKRTTTQRRTGTQRRTVRKKKRRTGPGGIYIPPPSEWF